MEDRCLHSNGYDFRGILEPMGRGVRRCMEVILFNQLDWQRDKEAIIREQKNAQVNSKNFIQAISDWVMFRRYLLKLIES